MDPVEKLVSETQIAFGIVGNPKTADFVLVLLGTGETVPPSFEDFLHGKGCYFLGAIGITAEQTPRVAFTEELPQAMLDSIRQTFLKLYERAITHVENNLLGDSAVWLEQLAALPDPRSMN